MRTQIHILIDIDIKIDDGENPLQFSRIFVLHPDGTSFFV